MSRRREEVVQRRLLLVEEDRHSIDALRDVFSDWGLECEVTLDMGTARNILLNRMMDVVVVNAALSGAKEETLIKDLRAGSAEMLIVVYNGTTNRARQRRLRRLGADSYLSKTSDLNAVVRAVQKLMELER